MSAAARATASRRGVERPRGDRLWGRHQRARALQAARHALATIGKSTAVTFQSAAGGELPRGPFDVGSLIDVMHHVPPVEQQGLFAGAAKRVRPGGVFYKDMRVKPRWKAWANRLHDLALARQWNSHRLSARRGHGAWFSAPDQRRWPSSAGNCSIAVMTSGADSRTT
jgi:SAM-dependent methyltransferase